MTSIANRYRILSKLGKGGMGVVYKAEDTLTENTVAVKHLKPELTSPELIERFRREGEALRELNHPNIVRMLDSVEEGGNHYLIIEYLSGGDLNDLLKQGQLTVEKVLLIAIDICDALTRAHRLNIIHRDLKPANVLLAEDGMPHLTDFGIAHFAGKQRVTDSDAIIGTIDYLAPEILENGILDTRADIWSFGVMLFEMLSGRLPFTGDSVTQTLLAIVTQPIPDLEALRPDAPLALVDLIYRMLEKDLYHRVPSVRIIGAELEGLLKGFDFNQTGTHSDRGLSVQVVETSRFATPTPTSHDIKHNLPSPTTPFVGREAELTELRRLLSDTKARLITILAFGGMGKTRLAIEFASQFIAALPVYNDKSAGESSNFANGVYLVELAPVRSANDIVATIATAVDFQFYVGEEPKIQLLNFFRTKNMLMVLDNYEHLLEGAILLCEILETASQVKIIVTSRMKLNVAGETLFTMGGMDFPDWETPEDALRYSAVQLFVQSARRVQPQFELTADNMDYVARICRFVGGMPLGIELAAAWLEMLTPQEIAAEIQASPDFLEAQGAEHPERHRSVRAVFEYSWNLLNEIERTVLMKLAAFRGSFSREAAQSVAEASLRDLMALVSKSLLHRDAHSGNYSIHELLRQYAEEHLNQSGVAATVHDTHSHYYLKLLREREPELIGPKGLDFLNDIEAHFEDVRGALLWAAQRGDYANLNGALHSIWTYFHIRSQFVVGNVLFEQLANYIRTQPPTTDRDVTLLHLLARQVRAYIWLRDKDAAKRSLEAARVLLNPETPREVEAFFILQEGLYFSVFQTEQLAHPYLEQAVGLYRDLGNIWGETDALNWLSTSYWSQAMFPDWQAAGIIIQQVVDKLKARGDVLWLARAMMNQGSVAMQSDYANGKRLYFEALSYAERANNKTVQANIWRNLAVASQQNYQFEEAIEFYKKGIVLNRETGNSNHISSILRDISVVYSQLGQYKEVEKYMTEALSMVEGSAYRDTIRETYIRLAENYCALGEYSKAQQYVERGLDITVENDYHGTQSWVHFRAGQVALWQQDWTTARRYLEQAIQLVQGTQNVEFDIREMETSIAQLSYYTGDYQEAITIAYRCADFFRQATGLLYHELFFTPTLNILSQALCATEQAAATQEIVVEALTLAHQSKTLWLQGQTLVAFAKWLAIQRPIHAAEIAALIQTEPRFTAYDKRDATHLLDTLQSKLPPSDYRSAFEQGKRLELETVLQALLTEFGENPPG